MDKSEESSSVFNEEDNVDNRIRLIREMSEQRHSLTSEHIDDLLQANPDLDTTFNIRSRFLKTLQVQIQCGNSLLITSITT